MTNEVTISGIIEEVFDMNNNLVLARLNCDNNIFYLFWGNQEYANLNLTNKYIIAKGSLEYIKVRTDKNNEVRRIMAIFVKGMESYDF